MFLQTTAISHVWREMDDVCIIIDGVPYGADAPVSGAGGAVVTHFQKLRFDSRFTKRRKVLFRKRVGGFLGKILHRLPYKPPDSLCEVWLIW